LLSCEDRFRGGRGNIPSSREAGSLGGSDCNRGRRKGNLERESELSGTNPEEFSEGEREDQFTG